MSVIGVDTNGIRNPDNGSPNGILPQQEGLDRQPAAEAGEIAARPDHPVAGDDDRDQKPRHLRWW